MNRMFLVPGILLIAAIVISCAPKIVPAEKTVSSKTPPSESRTTETMAWQGEWENTLAAARKEGKVSVYVTLYGPIVRTISKTFTDKYGLEVEVLPGRGEELTQKILSERRAGIYINDVVMSGFNTMFGFRRLGITTPLRPSLILPEVVDPKLWYTQNELPFGDEEGHLFAFIASPNPDIIVNGDMVNSEEIKSWHDLLDPKWKGKIIWADPSMAGSGFNAVSTLVYNKILDWDFYRQMVSRQQIQLTRDMRQQVDWLARGKFSVAISAESTPIAEFIKEGVNLRRVAVKEGTYVTATAGVVFINDKAPHLNASKVFINWLLTGEGQTVLVQSFGYPSRRPDVSTEGISPVMLPQPGQEVFSEDEDFINFKVEMLGISKKVIEDASK